MNTNTSFVVRNKNARTLRLIGEKLIQLASLAERADEKGRPLKVEGGVMLHEMSDDKCDEVAYVLQVGDSEMRITVDTHTLELVKSPYDAAVDHFADVGFSSARRACEEAAPVAQTEQQPVAWLYRGTDMGDQLSFMRLDHYWRRKYSHDEHDYAKGIPLYAAPIPQAEQAPKRDREADRARFPDPAFNKWLDEGISDAGHTVWDQVNVYDAWAGWENRQFYAEPVAQTNIADLPFEKLFAAISLAVDAGDVPVGVSVKKFRKVLGIQPNQAQTDELDKLRAVVSSVAAEQFHTMPWNHPHCRCSRCDLIREARDALSQQTTPQKYDDVLLPFLGMMRTELRANAGKGDRAGWLSMNRETCLLEIYYHLAKLQKATIEDAPSGIREHAADVANMSMMLVDICGLLIEQGETK